MALVDDLEAALATFQQQINELPKWLNVFAQSMRGTAGNKAAGAAGGVSNAAINLSNNVAAMISIFQQIIITSPGSTMKMGFAEPFNFVGGSVGESKTITVTGQDWVKVGVSRIVPFNNTPATSSAIEYYSPTVTNLVDGVGFDVSLTTTDAATPLGKVGSVFWIGLPDG